VSWNTQGTIAKEGDLVELVGLNHKHFIITLKPGGELQSHRGVLKHDDLIGKTWGSQVFSHMGSPFFLLQPSLADLLRGIKRNTQIIYPKEIGYILVRMGIGPGMMVGEAGTGSGALTTAFAFSVGDEGRIFTYDQKEENLHLAQKNLQKVGLDHRVVFHHQEIKDGFQQRDLDAVFLDMNNPYDYMGQVREALKPGGFFGAILPTSNQVCKLLDAMRQERFAFVDVLEISMRFFKAESERFRPVDRMVAHTGYLIFARPVVYADAEGMDELLEETNRQEDQ
jgi:tRNA (adenine57-N1/adenine58-N1)-methyltransferase